MAHEKILILEGSWAEEDEEYISDTRSTGRIYRGIEALLSLQEIPINIIQRPLLSMRFIEDIKQFALLKANKKGVNIIIISGHGSKEKIEIKGKLKHRREITAFDEEVNLSKKIDKVYDNLGRSIIILDACDVGKDLKSFYITSGALGVIGFSKEVSWIDSSVLILALLCKYQKEGVFQMQRVSSARPKKIIDGMKNGPYTSVFKKLGVIYYFDGY